MKLLLLLLLLLFAVNYCFSLYVNNFEHNSQFLWENEL